MKPLRIKHFEGSRRALRPQHRVQDIKAAALDFRRDFIASGQIRYYQSFELVRVPFPTKYAYSNAYAGVTPFLHLCNKMTVIQFDTAAGLKTLLVGPSDWEHQRETPFFAALDAKSGRLGRYAEPLLFKKTATVLDCLTLIGLAPEDVDYLTYDHLHTQNLQRWLGPKAIFPNAKLLVMRAEWESAQGLLPWHNQWYCPKGVSGIAEDRIIALEGDVQLGAGLALIATKGHTEGNHSIVAHTPKGILVTSENGVGLDSYAPERSKVPGVAAFAKATGAEVVLNGNTLEYAVDQYLSMVQEKTIAGPNPDRPEWPNMAPSSESAAHWLFPQTAPTASVGNFCFGHYTAPSRN